MESFIRATAWTMEKPTPYGSFHLIASLIGFALAFFLAWRLRKVGEKGHRAVLAVCGGLLLLFELYKQLFYFYVDGNGHYVWWIFPFQMCSVPMYLCLIIPWLKTGKISQSMLNFMMTYNLLGGLMAFIEPSGIVHGYWTLTLHAFVWHMMLVFIGVYLILSKRGGRSFGSFKQATVVFWILSAVAFGLNVALRGVSGGSVNNFYLGPSNTPLAVFKQITEATAWYVNTPIYIIALMLGAFIVFLPVYLLHKKKEKVYA